MQKHFFKGRFISTLLRSSNGNMGHLWDDEYPAKFCCSWKTRAEVMWSPCKTELSVTHLSSGASHRTKKEKNLHVVFFPLLFWREKKARVSNTLSKIMITIFFFRQVKMHVLLHTKVQWNLDRKKGRKKIANLGDSWRFLNPRNWLLYRDTTVLR